MLDAPSLCDDFYLNLVDWSALNVVAVSLGSCVYVWSAYTSKVTLLCDVSPDGVTAVTWNIRGDQLAVATNGGRVQIWNVSENKVIRDIRAHNSRVGVLSWSSSLLASGGRDKHIYVHDLRIRPQPTYLPDDNQHQHNNNSNSNNSQPALNRVSTTTGVPTDDSPDLDFIGTSSTSTSAESSTRFGGTPSAPTSLSRQLARVDADRASIIAANPLSVAPTPTNLSSRNPAIVFDFNQHKQEVCGLKWSFDEKMLASGGNDNRLLIWSVTGGSNGLRQSTAANMNEFNPNQPLHEFTDHTAAVKVGFDYV